jgi:hypothetical protein
MATDLYILTNAKFSPNQNLEYFDTITKKLKAIPLTRASYQHKGKWVEEEGDWSFNVEQEEDEGVKYFSVWYDGPYAYFPIMFPNICYISTIFRYSTLYHIHDSDWVDSFRMTIYNIIKALDGSEVIFVADNACDKLSGYLSMAWANYPYEEIKEKMFKEFGEPVTDYSKLDYKKLDYRNINEFVFDNFIDFKQKAL